MLAKLQAALVFNPILAAGLAQALGTAAGIIQTIGLVAVFGGLIGAAVSALSERHLSGVKASLVIAAIEGLAVLLPGRFRPSRLMAKPGDD